MSDTVAELKVIPKRKYSAKIVGYGAKPSAKGKQMMTLDCELSDNSPFQYEVDGEEVTIDVNGRQFRTYLTLEGKALPIAEKQLAAIHHVNGKDAPNMDAIISNLDDLEEVYVGCKLNVTISGRQVPVLDEVTKDVVTDSFGNECVKFQMGNADII